MLETLSKLTPSDFPMVRRGRLDTLQVNLGYRCNQQCRGCHVNAGPTRKEVMARAIVDTVLTFIEKTGIPTLGAPELNPAFRRLVTEARTLGCRVLDRCNLTVLEEPDQADLAEFLAGQQVEVIASLPCYLAENVDAQRGDGVYHKSIRALKRLNELDYGQEQSRLTLTLVYNPGGAYLPPGQARLEADYRRELAGRYGIRFTRLFTLTNIPIARSIARFGSILLSRGEFDDYMGLLKSAMCPTNLDSLMCRSLISIDWRGRVYDCDFNQMLGLPVATGNRQEIYLTDLSAVDLEDQPVVVADHCYGCAAEQGSGCGAELS